MEWNRTEQRKVENMKRLDAPSRDTGDDTREQEGLGADTHSRYLGS